MAYEIPGFSWTLPASTGILNTQFRFVTINASGQAAFPAAGAHVVGVMTSKPKTSGEATTVVSDGIVKVQAAAASTITTGDLVAASSAGRVILGTSNNVVVGRVVSGSSGSASRILSVLLTGNDSNP